ncbi:thiamine pyrophosphokinase-related protein [Xylariaceae sp. FL1651]|nr:thiamine pyrophosphokinase-related protein [Xylariaceae sp. FL1651]
MSQSHQTKSFLDLVNECDNFPLPQNDINAYAEKVHSYYHFKVASNSATFGFVLPFVATELAKFQGWEVDENTTPKTLTLSGGDDESSRSAHVAETLRQLRQNKTFDVLDKWRDECMSVFSPTGELLFSIERSAFPLLGVVAYGIRMVAYTRLESGDMKLWISRRSNKVTAYPGFLDGTVAGAILTGESSYESMIRKTCYKASLPEDLVRQRWNACGTLSYFHIRNGEAGGEVGLLHPSFYFLFDLELPQDVEPKPGDDEVQRFSLLDVETVKVALLAGQFEPSFALVMLDFFIRHGIINAMNEPDSTEIFARLHRAIELPTCGPMFSSH